MNKTRRSESVKKRHGWEGWLLICLMTLSGLGWLLLVIMTWTGGSMAEWLPNWPWWYAALLAGLILFGTWGFYSFKSWGWIVAMLYVLFGFLCLASQLLAFFTPLSEFLFLLPVISLVSIPYLFRKRDSFLQPTGKDVQ